jgi:hypothetical protein
VVEEDVQMAPQRLRWAPQNLVGVWLHHSPMLTLVYHRSNLAAPEFLQNFVVHLLLGPWKTFSYNPSLLSSFAGTRSSSSNQSSSPQEKVLTFLPKGANSPSPLWSLLSHLHLYISLSSYIPREVPGRRWFGFLVIPGFQEIANIERQHPEPISLELDVANNTTGWS